METLLTILAIVIIVGLILIVIGMVADDVRGSLWSGHAVGIGTVLTVAATEAVTIITILNAINKH